MTKGKPEAVMRDNGKRSISRIFRHCLVLNHDNDKRTPFLSALTMENRSICKVVKNEYLAIENILNKDDNKIMYDDMFVNAYDEVRDNGRDQ